MTKEDKWALAAKFVYTWYMNLMTTGKTIQLCMPQGNPREKWTNKGTNKHQQTVYMQNMEGIQILN